MKDTTIFKNTTLQELLFDICSETVSKRGQILGIINQLKDHLNSKDDAAVFAPMIKQYFDVMVQNDDHLIKVANIAQRIISAESYSNKGDIEEILTEEEKHHLLKQAISEIEEDQKNVNSQIIDLNTQLPKDNSGQGDVQEDNK